MTFRRQVPFILEALKNSPSGLVTHQDIAHTFSRNPESIAFQIERLSGVIHPVRRPRLLTPGTLTAEGRPNSQKATFEHLNLRQKFNGDINVDIIISYRSGFFNN
jgi:hypothetical protein